MTIAGARWWVMWINGWRWRFIRAADPCWKGEVQIGPLVIGWQRTPPKNETARSYNA